MIQTSIIEELNGGKLLQSQKPRQSFPVREVKNRYVPSNLELPAFCYGNTRFNLLAFKSASAVLVLHIN